MAAPPTTRNWFAVGVSVIVAVIVLGIGGALLLSQSLGSAKNDGSGPSVSGIDWDTGAVRFGTGRETVATSVDFMCPHCAAFETQYGDQLSRLAVDDRITLALHPIGLLDSASAGTEFSRRAANAFSCVADADPAAAMPFARALFDRQPRDGAPGLDDAAIVELAKTTGADIRQCQADGQHRRQVAADTKAMPPNPESGRPGTPTVVIDGAYVQLQDIVSNATWFADRSAPAK